MSNNGNRGKEFVADVVLFRGTVAEFAGKEQALYDKYYNKLIAVETAEQGNDVFKRNVVFGDLVVPDSKNIEVLYVPEGVQKQNYFPIIVNGDCSVCRTLIVIEKGASARIAFRFVPSGQPIRRFVEIYLAENAALEMVEQLGEAERLVNTVIVKQSKKSRFKDVVVASGGESINNHKIILAGAHAEAYLYGLSVLSGKERVEHNTIIEHAVSDCESSEHYKTVVDEKAQASFFGRIYVASDAQHTNAYQQNNNIFLSDTAKAYTRPQLEIYADDVKCSHGATIGQLDEEAVYYMRQRGISGDMAKKLQITGFIGDIIKKVGDDTLEEEIASKIKL